MTNNNDTTFDFGIDFDTDFDTAFDIDTFDTVENPVFCTVSQENVKNPVKTNTVVESKVDVDLNDVAAKTHFNGKRRY